MGQVDWGKRIDRASGADGVDGVGGVDASDGRTGWACHCVKLLCYAPEGSKAD